MELKCFSTRTANKFWMLIHRYHKLYPESILNDALDTLFTNVVEVEKWACYDLFALGLELFYFSFIMCGLGAGKLFDFLGKLEK